MGKLITDNPELLLYTEAGFHVTVLGGIKLTGLDRLRVTLKITLTGKTERAYRHNLDLYNGIQCGQLAERLSEILDRTESEVTALIANLTTALENYRSERLKEMKPKQAEKKELTESERREALKFLKSGNLIQKTKEAIAASDVIGEESNALIAYLTDTSRKRHVPLHLMCLGASGTGKIFTNSKLFVIWTGSQETKITKILVK